MQYARGVPALLIACVLALAFANGANDNFKGVATLHGSGRSSFRVALSWATLTTFAGSLTAVWLGAALARTFSGKGLVPAELVVDPAFVTAVAIGASATVLLATRFGFPISTTHAIVGALVGAGLAIAGGDVRFSVLGTKLVLPLLLSPIAALVLTIACYRLLRWWRLSLGLTEASYVTLAETADEPDAGDRGSALVPALAVRERQLEGRVAGVEAQSLLDFSHFVSSGTVSFARGLNDTPKIAAMLALLQMSGVASPSVLVGFAIAIGGLLAARKVARTLSHDITDMNSGQGFAANLVTGGLVISASVFGLGVSTTHVSVGALFGVGAANGSARRRAIVNIALAWVATLPIAAAIAWGATFALRP